MLKAVELLAARGRDDLRVVRYQCGSLPEYHVIFEAPAVDTEVDPPRQNFPANDDEPKLTHCTKAQRLCAKSFCLLCELAERSLRTNDSPANLKKIQYDLLFSRRSAGARSEHIHQGAPGL
jgi:hypothetical protein